ncbi:MULTISPECIES: pyruvate dehydrogenase (acetyl-transferring) E1 component subunit alpha [Caldilinea]|jgi:pyruvate dehydrogenase E1 component alpha subunit|uniref:Pyruvate dehydrogenase E1 component subunit alpha n=1 Tax=Caldilinea aerophila (strain DSM 14535 / JCM 11387 / NBRC 104270 / STL-6-O1) TaxID=926550 RepID=I0I6U9_CALAS|nr:MULTISPECIES: pyruvate dehydrogenase (acetyl-transferring) E1 component subunit alpha [Caldilinea]MBO9394086.1 pyruvate dehydrogenase (acetyl-transferring) E1 component subunit alpha [Caldilinea sp.]BAM00987.1 acetoin dehydrogenase E1 component alpha subunit [Caldilinea aerophila DSM 14535 = NBRC 104270]GIV72325.1 MAG: acetoin:2,6-dichlorophenolindophenol oxidoreductase subunit alpha [Caldilinea sp.]
MSESFADLSPERLHALLHQMMLIRAFEEAAEQLYLQGLIHGTMHLSVGQEASAVGACAALRPTDYILSTHRGHGHCIAKGARVDLMMAEFFGKETGYCRGRGGSMHMADVDTGNLGANGIVAGGVPMAAGVGLSIQMQRQDRVVLVFFGDGATNEGAFHESLNLAAIWNLPVIYFCENNQYAMSMAITRASKLERLSDRACAYGIPGVTVDGNDLIAVYCATKEAVERARSGGGPTLIEAQTYRWKGHSKSDKQRYRTKEEVKAWQERDPIARLAQRMIEASLLTEDDLQRLQARVDEEIAAAIEFAKASPEPDPATILEGVYA